MTTLAPAMKSQAVTIPAAVTASTSMVQAQAVASPTVQQRLRGFVLGAVAACGAYVIRASSLPAKDGHA